MEFADLIRACCSVRQYADRPLAQETLRRILEAGNVAPTATNAQPHRIYVLQSEEALTKIRGITRCAFNAPVVLMMTYDKTEQWHNPLEAGITAGEQDVSIVATHMMLAAWDMGVASVWVNYFPVTETAKAFQLPENEQLVLLMPLGYAAEGVEPNPRHFQKKPLEEIVRYL